MTADLIFHRRIMAVFSHSRRQVFNLGLLVVLLSSQYAQSFSLGTTSLSISPHDTKHPNALPSAAFVGKTKITTSLSSQANDDSDPATPTFPQTPPPPTAERLDPLVQSLTRMDDDVANGPTRNVPFFGEIPADGSILILAPVALIAVIGFILTIQIAFTSKDVWVSAIDELNAQLSKPPVKETVVTNSCRGLCSDQDEQLESLRSFMQGLASPKSDSGNVVVAVEQTHSVEAKVVGNSDDLGKSDLAENTESTPKETK